MLRCIEAALGDRLAGSVGLFNPHNLVAEPAVELYVVPMGYGSSDYPAARKGNKTAIYTMWETDCLNKRQAEFLRRFDVVMVPCTWCRDVFAEAGITAHVVPPYVEIIEGPGSRDKLLAGGAASPIFRKRLDKVVDLLHATGEAYSVRSDDPSVFPGCGDKMDFTWASTEDHEAWFRSGKLFLNLCSGEGWGLFQHKALAHGLPLVTPCHGGLVDFVTPENSYIIPHTEVFASGYFAVGLGKWADVKIEEAEEVLRFALNDPGLKVKQVAAAASVAHFTKARMRRELLAALELSGQ